MTFQNILTTSLPNINKKMEPIKFEVSISVNVDLSQGTKDFVSQIVEKKIEAAQEANEGLKDSLEPIKAVLGMLQSGCCCNPVQNPIEKELNAVAEAEKEAIASVEAAVKQQETAPKPLQPESQAQPASTISIESVRAVLATKVNDHREAIKNKLNELGAPSVTKLDPSKYQEMYDFLNNL